MMPQTPAQFAAAQRLTGPSSAPANPPSQFILHRTIAGERWDALAWKYYGDPTLINPLIVANPGVPIEAAFEAGLVIAVPILEEQSGPQDLPPWGGL